MRHHIPVHAHIHGCVVKRIAVGVGGPGEVLSGSTCMYCMSEWRQSGEVVASVSISRNEIQE